MVRKCSRGNILKKLGVFSATAAMSLTAGITSFAGFGIEGDFIQRTSAPSYHTIGCTLSEADPTYLANIGVAPGDGSWRLTDQGFYEACGDKAASPNVMLGWTFQHDVGKQLGVANGRVTSAWSLTGNGTQAMQANLQDKDFMERSQKAIDGNGTIGVVMNAIITEVNGNTPLSRYVANPDNIYDEIQGCFSGNTVYTVQDAYVYGKKDEEHSFLYSLEGYDSHNRNELIGKHNWKAGVPQDIEEHYLLVWYNGNNPLPPIGEEDEKRPDGHGTPTGTITKIGVDKPEGYTYNTSDEFNVGEAIPSGENLTNGVIANKWFGTAEIEEVPKVTNKYYVKFNFELPYTFKYDVEYYRPKDDETAWTGYMSITGTEKASKTLSTSREAYYYALHKLGIYSLAKITVTNGAYGAQVYTADFGTIPVTALMNGTDVGSATGTYVTDQSKHLAWSQPNGATIQINKRSGRKTFWHDYDDWNDKKRSKAKKKAEKQAKIDAKKKAKSALNEWISDNMSSWQYEADHTSLLTVTAQNDYLSINNIVYLDNAAKSSNVAGQAPVMPTVRQVVPSQLNRQSPVPGDLGIFMQSAEEYIEPETRNGTYETYLSLMYKMTSPATGTIAREEKRGRDATWDVYDQNEPVRVHTPVISPVSIINPETKTQLITENDIGSEVKKLRLDGTYTISFDPEQWYDTEFPDKKLRGYENNANKASRYDKYVFDKKVKFPFAVAISDPRTSKETYYNVKSDGYTEWISCPDNKFDFYIPSWAKENTTAFGNNSTPYDIKFRVEATNAYEDDEGQDTMNSDLDMHVATYDIYVNVSGVIYNFQIVGVNDSDMFRGYSAETSKTVDVPFALYREEKKAGTNNRFGNPFVRYTLDGQLKGSWPVKDTIALRPGSSSKYSDMGALWKGSTFSFSVKTIANLSDSNDEIKITPTFGYIDEDGNYHNPDELAIYYSDENGNFIEYGSAKDKANKKYVSLSSDQFKGSWYEGNSPLFSNSLVNQLMNKKDNAGKTYLSMIPDNLTYTAQKAGKTNDAFKNTKTASYSLSEIVLKPSMRLLSGDAEELERNQSYERTNPRFDNLTNMIGTESGKETTDTFRSSMQTWYGQYKIPSELYVTYKNKFDPNGDGTATPIGKNVTPGTGDDLDGNGVVDLRDLAKAEKLTKDSDIWLKNGYLDLNFDIKTENGGVDHLYYGGSTYATTLDMWDPGHENHTKTITVEKQKPDGTPRTERTTVDSKDGDVALIDNRYSIKDKYSARIFMTN